MEKKNIYNNRLMAQNIYVVALYSNTEKKKITFEANLYI